MRLGGAGRGGGTRRLPMLRATHSNITSHRIAPSSFLFYFFAPLTLHFPSTPSSRARHQQIELKTGETYRGTLLESEDNWNCQLQGITHTGKVRQTSCATHPPPSLRSSF